MISNLNLLAKCLQESELTLALAESMTCGLASHQFTTVKGASGFFKGGIVCYSPEVKCSLIGVDKKLIEKYTAESQQVTDALVKNLKNLIDADIYGAITGLASADGSQSMKKPKGSVFISVLYKNKVYRRHKVFRGEPLKIKRKACDELYEFLYSVLSEK
jgi:nicotinamide-nucleotide amidase